MKILVLDNYDSFTYNLVQMVEQIVGKTVTVAKIDSIQLPEIEEFDKIILSPGPGIPSEAGILLEMIKKYASKKSILGVCLGQQAIAEAFGGSLMNLSQIFHGVSTPTHILKKDSQLFRNIPDKFEAGRYHSWVVNRENFPQELEITADDENGMIMALQHKQYPVFGVQFHPESILTPQGKNIIRNFVLD